jgi:general L-amino acid transport system permease protein
MKNWIRHNLFRSWSDGILSIVFGTLAVWVIWVLVEFIFITGRWEIIQVNIKLLLIGGFPLESLWLINASVISIAFWMSSVFGNSAKASENNPKLTTKVTELLMRFGLIFGLGVLIVLLIGFMESISIATSIIAAIILGRFINRARWRIDFLARIPTIVWHVLLVLPPVTFIFLTLEAAELKLWGGFLINFYIAIVSIVLCFPLGVLLALGRRSTLPIIRLICATYIEIVRGSPLFVLLLLSGVALEFFIPQNSSPGSVARAITVFTLFTAAYLAEIVRGGLQSIPTGQIEAGKAIGLSPVKATVLITLPQALRNVIPAQIGQFISLFKDTTLAGAALSIVELLKVSEAITKQPDFLGQGYIYEALAFVSLLFWVGSFVMSKESQRLEKRLGVGQR